MTDKKLTGKRLNLLCGLSGFILGCMYAYEINIGSIQFTALQLLLFTVAILLAISSKDLFLALPMATMLYFAHIIGILLSLRFLSESYVFFGLIFYVIVGGITILLGTILGYFIIQPLRNYVEKHPLD